MQREQIELQGIQFPAAIREEGASIEILQLDSKSQALKDLESWATENQLDAERKWGVISHARSKEESVFLALSFRRVTRTRYRVQSGKLSRQQEEVTEPELGELHIRKDGVLELYSVPAKQKNMAVQSLGDFFGGKEAAQTLGIPKDAMIGLMKEAVEVSSVSLTGIGNPFFSDVTLSGSDPANSRTFKELLPSATIKSFRGKFHLDSGSDSGDGESLVIATINSSCKVRFFGGQTPLAQADIEEFVSRVRKIASAVNESE